MGSFYSCVRNGGVVKFIILLGLRFVRFLHEVVGYETTGVGFVILDKRFLLKKKKSPYWVYGISHRAWQGMT